MPTMEEYAKQSHEQRLQRLTRTADQDGRGPHIGSLRGCLNVGQKRPTEWISSRSRGEHSDAGQVWN